MAWHCLAGVKVAVKVAVALFGVDRDMHKCRWCLQEKPAVAGKANHVALV